MQIARTLKRERTAILDLEPKAAMERILDAPEPAPLVHSFPEEDLYLLIQDIGAGDALALISLASDAQLEFILDMDIWAKDRINRLSSERWITLFSQADPFRLVRWLMDQKTAFAEYYLSQNIEVRIREHDQDPSDWGDGFVTFDNTFYIRPLTIAGEPEEAETQRKSHLIQMLSRMADRDYERCRDILLETATVIPAEYEEQAYRFRNVRLAEKGFLPFEEAIGIYQPLKARDFDAKVERFIKPEPPDDSLFSVPLYPSTMAKTGGLFPSALTHIASGKDLDRIQVEFAALCNTIAVADGKEIRDRESLSAVVGKACGYLGIGLERITGDDRNTGCRQSSVRIVKTPLSDIFRVGYGAAVELKWRAQKWQEQSWFETQGLPLTFWGEKWLGVLGGLLIKKPLFFDDYRTGVLYREFATLDDVDETETVLDRVIAVDAMLNKMGTPLKKVEYQFHLSFKNFVLTLWARHCLGLSQEPVPLKLDDFKRFFEDLWPGGAKPRKIPTAMKENFFHWLVDRTGVSAEDISKNLGQSLEALFQEIESEYGAVSAKHLDPRYVGLFLIEK